MIKKYQLTKQIQSIIPLITEKYNKEIQIENYKVLYLDIKDKAKCKEATIGCYDQYVSDTGNLMTVEQGDRATTLSHDFVSKIEEPQIREILIALQEELGENPTYSLVYNMEINLLKHSKMSEANKKSDVQHRINPLFIGFPTRSETFCNKWLDGLKPLFDTDPIAVLTELLEILTNLNNQ